MKRRGGWFLNLDWQGVTDLQQAQYLVRSFLAFAGRDVQRAYIYFYDDREDCAYVRLLESAIARVEASPRPGSPSNSPIRGFIEAL